MATSTPRPGAARKPAVSKDATAIDAAAVPAARATSRPAPAAVAAPVTAPVAAPAPVASAPAPGDVPPSVVGRLRRNRMGAVLGGLIVAVAFGLLLSIFVPDSNLLLALSVLGLAESLAVGFTVRYLTDWRGLTTQLTAFVLATIGVHLMVTTGMVNQAAGSVGSLVDGLMGGRGGGASGIGWDDAALGALATPAVSTGAVVCGLIAAIVAGWGTRIAYSRVDDAA